MAENVNPVQLDISFKANLFRKEDMPKALTDEATSAAEGVWGIEELQVGDEDFVVVFARTSTRRVD
jgi:hypothetical protein